MMICAAAMLASCSKPAPEPKQKAQPVQPVVVKPVSPSPTVVKPVYPESPLASMPDRKAARERGADAFYFERKDKNRLEFPVRIVYYDDLRLIARVYRNFGGGHGGTIYSFSVERDGVCEIHTMDPEKWYIPQYIGHEVMHCAHGNFHN